MVASKQQPPWWQGKRGEWYVVLQVALLALLAFGPRHLDAVPSLPAWAVLPTIIAGIVLLLLGGLLMAAAVLGLGRRLTPLPFPKDGATLVRSGAYRIVRHPIYSGALLASFGFAFVVQGILTVGYAIAIFIFLDVKSRKEERWLCERHPDYPDYRRTVRKLIPFVY